MIFLIATDEPVSWSFAELMEGSCEEGMGDVKHGVSRTRRDQTRLDNGD